MRGHAAVDGVIMRAAYGALGGTADRSWCCRSPIVPTLGLLRPEGRPAWSATGFAGTRSEQSGSSADAAAHQVGVNRAQDQAEHDCMQLLSPMLTGFVGCPR